MQDIWRHGRITAAPVMALVNLEALKIKRLTARVIGLWNMLSSAPAADTTRHLIFGKTASPVRYANGNTAILASPNNPNALVGLSRFHPAISFFRFLR